MATESKWWGVVIEFKIHNVSMKSGNETEERTTVK